MNDLISRKEAIEKIESHTRVGDELYPLTDTDKILNHAFEIAASCVYNLPSAQPEIIRCRDCRYYQDNNNGYPHMNCKWDANETPDEDDFCSGAERRTDD